MRRSTILRQVLSQATTSSMLPRCSRPLLNDLKDTCPEAGNTQIVTLPASGESYQPWSRRTISTPAVRSSTAVKFAYLDDTYNLLGRLALPGVVDLGAAPGGICQIVSERLTARLRRPSTPTALRSHRPLIVAVDTRELLMRAPPRPRQSADVDVIDDTEDTRSARIPHVMFLRRSLQTGGGQGHHQRLLSSILDRFVSVSERRAQGDAAADGSQPTHWYIAPSMVVHDAVPLVASQSVSFAQTGMLLEAARLSLELWHAVSCSMTSRRGLASSLCPSGATVPSEAACDNTDVIAFWDTLPPCAVEGGEAKKSSEPQLSASDRASLNFYSNSFTFVSKLFCSHHFNWVIDVLRVLFSTVDVVDAASAVRHDAAGGRQARRYLERYVVCRGVRLPPAWLRSKANGGLPGRTTVATAAGFRDATPCFSMLTLPPRPEDTIVSPGERAGDLTCPPWRCVGCCRWVTQLRCGRCAA